MTFLDLLARRSNPLENPQTPLGGQAVWDFLTGEPSASGETVGPVSALTIGAYYAGVRFIAETIGSLPCRLYERDGGKKTVLRDDSRYVRLNAVANDSMTAGTVREVMQGHLCTWGNAYAQKVVSPRGELTELWPLKPDCVTPLVDKGRIGGYRVTTVSGDELLTPSEVLHIPGFGYNGLVGYSVVHLARETLGLAKAEEKTAGQFFGNGLQASGVLIAPQRMTDQTRAALRDAVTAQTTGANRRGLLVLEGGLTFEQMGIPPGDAQFLESREFSVVEIARWLDLPPHILKDLNNATYSNIEAQSLELVTFSLRRWFVRWEQHLNMSLLSEAERRAGLYFKIEDRALLRGDTASRGQWYRERFQLGSMSPNDVRALEDEDEIDGGDQYFVNAAMIPLEQAMQLTVDERAKLLHGEAEATTDPFPTEWSRDVWSQVVRGELRELRKVLSRGDSLSEYYDDRFVPFATKRLAPLFRALGRDDLDTVVIDYAVDALRAFADVSESQYETILEDWHGRIDVWSSL